MWLSCLLFPEVACKPDITVLKWHKTTSWIICILMSWTSITKLQRISQHKSQIYNFVIYKRRDKEESTTWGTWMNSSCAVGSRHLRATCAMLSLFQSPSVILASCTAHFTMHNPKDNMETCWRKLSWSWMPSDSLINVRKEYCCL